MAMKLQKKDTPVCRVYYCGDVPRAVRDFLIEKAPPAICSQ